MLAVEPFKPHKPRMRLQDCDSTRFSFDSDFDFLIDFMGKYSLEADTVAGEALRHTSTMEAAVEASTAICFLGDHVKDDCSFDISNGI